jgi:hypothetical protein
VLINRTSLTATLICLTFASILLAQENLNSVQDAMDLPGGFAQLDALYSLAASSDAMEIQGFVYEADELEDAISRRSALIVLFSRLVEVDPRSAVAISRGPRFANDRRYETEVWTEWARIDMPAALSAATKITGAADKNLVAQALFSANRRADFAVMQEIIDELGVRPDRNSQTQFAVQLSNRSRKEALDYINSIPSQSEQQSIANTVGTYLGRRDAVEARKVADRLRSPQTRLAYLANVERGAGARDPRAAVDRALSNPVAAMRVIETSNAMKEYARVDARGAAAYVKKIDNQTLRLAVENSIVGPMAMQDPDFAMQWAQKQDPKGRRGLYSVALAQTAVADPDAAFASAMAVDDRAPRQLAMQRVLSVVGQLEPKRAVGMLDRIRDEEDLLKAHSMVAQSWIKSDPDAAIDWLTGDPRLNEPAFCMEIAPVLVEADVYAAQRLLSRLDGRSAQILQTRIASTLVTEHTVQETMAFINEIDDEEQRKELTMRGILSLSETAPNDAVEWLRALPRDPQTDYLVMMTIARRDPDLAQRLLQEISLPAEQHQQLEEMLEKMRTGAELTFD